LPATAIITNSHENHTNKEKGVRNTLHNQIVLFLFLKKGFCQRELIFQLGSLDLLPPIVLSSNTKEKGEMTTYRCPLMK
jgi:hypothetical protein